MYLVVFLGNPEPEYRGTRHNIARLVTPAIVDASAHWKEKFNARYSDTFVGSHKVLFVEPATYMNLSGQPVSRLASFFKIPTQNIIVLHDDLELSFGTVSVRKGGGTAGHNGLRSIAQLLGSPDFIRVRIGIGRPKRGDVASFVLGKFTPDEHIALDGISSEAAEAVEKLLSNP
ncbi:aminoacyl-tRNA hydrolase [bacterium]|nr:aminoacyl-tRNA hydrolase [bacterium]